MNVKSSLPRRKSTQRLISTCTQKIVLTFLSFCLIKSSTSTIKSVYFSGLGCKLIPLWCGIMTGRSGGSAKIFLNDQASKKSNSMSVCDSSNVAKATKPYERRGLSIPQIKWVAKAFIPAQQPPVHPNSLPASVSVYWPNVAWTTP